MHSTPVPLFADIGKFVTSKGRRSPFNQTLINGDVRVERQVPPDDMVMTGMYMRMIVSSAYGANFSIHY